MCSDHTAYANINNYNVHTCSTQYMYMSHNSVYKLGVFYTFNFWGNRFILHNDLSFHITWIKKNIYCYDNFAVSLLSAVSIILLFYISLELFM